MTDVDGMISVIKFQRLVDERCRNREDILDLCEKSLRTYRPSVFNQQTQNLNPFPPRDTRPTYVLRAGYTMDELTIRSSRLAGPELEYHVLDRIGKEMLTEVYKNNLIKIGSVSSPSSMQRLFTGTMEVIVK